MDIFSVAGITLYIIAAIALYSVLLHAFSNTDYYPFNKAPVFYAVVLSLTIGGAMFLIMVDDLYLLEDEKLNIQFIPKLNNSKESIQYCDIEQLKDIWYDPEIKNGSLYEIFSEKWRNILIFT